jgi:hypothetical protein
VSLDCRSERLFNLRTKVGSPTEAPAFALRASARLACLPSHSSRRVARERRLVPEEGVEPYKRVFLKW